MGESLDGWLERYFDTFGEGMPMYQVGRSRTEKELIEIIKDCIEHKKDAYDMGYVDDDDDMY